SEWPRPRASYGALSDATVDNDSLRRTSMRVLAALVLTVLGLWPSVAAAQAVKIGAVVPLTGRYGAGGAQVRAGYDIAVEHINAGGGVSMGGRKVPLELVLLDDESDATKTVARLESLGAQG